MAEDTNQIPFLDLRAQFLDIEKAIHSAIDKVLNSTRFVLGDEVKSFEEEFSSYAGVGQGVAVNSGTSALHLALLAVGVRPGDEIITVPFTFVATVAAILYAGARPVFVDVDPFSYTMDTTALEKAISSKTKAILPVHLYGQPADLDPILEIARRHDLFVIEDAAQAHGSFYKGKKVGSIGDIGCFSFYPGKNLGAYGEGGMAVTNNNSFADKMRMLRDWGQRTKYQHDLKGYNYRMDEIQGAILRVKLPYLEAWTEARRSRAKTYSDLLLNSCVTTPTEMPYARHVYHLYTIRFVGRDELQHNLKNQNIETAVHYPKPVHVQKAYADLGYHYGDFPNSEILSKEVLSLPIYPELPISDLKRITAYINKIAY